MKNKRGLAAISSGLTVLLLAAVVATGSRAVPSVSAAEEPLYMFNVIGDMQMGDPNCYDEENYKAALEDIKSISPETKAILTVGDHTNNGSEAEYKTQSRTIFYPMCRYIIRSEITTGRIPRAMGTTIRRKTSGWTALLNTQS